MVKSRRGIAERNPEPIIIQAAVQSFCQKHDGVIFAASNGVGGAFVDDGLIPVGRLQSCRVCNDVLCSHVAESIPFQLSTPL